MVFSSHIFVFYFLPFALASYYLLPQRWRNLWLTIISYFFYGWANPLFAFLMISTTFTDYLCGLWLAGASPFRKDDIQILPKGPRTRSQKAALTISVVTNLVVLGFFKYFNFGLDNINSIAQSFGYDGIDAGFRVVLPLGISFYTFQAMSYCIDIYRSDAKAIRNFTDFSCYVSMFPQLVAGPIIRFQDVADQLIKRNITPELIGRGVSFFALGMAKKILLANPCGKIADTVFNAGSASVVDSWQGLFAYSFQIYFDFSAYSDMAIGLGLMFGFVFAKNFDSPYISQSITEFWRRWHLSLSTWLRDNLYIPLGGNRKGEVRTYINLFLVMFLGGLWHGASWNFIIWGSIHGLVLGIERLDGKHGLYRRFPKVVRIAMTFLIVNIAWVFFRAPDLPRAMEYFRNMFGLTDVQPGAVWLSTILHAPYYLGSMIIAAVVVWACPQAWNFTRQLTWPKAVICAALLLLAIVVMEAQSFNPFIYFIF